MPNNTIDTHRSIWSEPWRRVIEREEYGLIVQFSNVPSALNNLYKHRPPTCRDYTICRASDPTILIICRPGLDPGAEYRDNAVAMINDNDIPDLD